MSKKDTWSYSYQYRQDYPGYLTPKFLVNLYTEEQKQDQRALAALAAEQEIERLDAVDREVDLMTRYPDAEAMIERLKRDFL